MEDNTQDEIKRNILLLAREQMTFIHDLEDLHRCYGKLIHRMMRFIEIHGDEQAKAQVEPIEFDLDRTKESTLSRTLTRKPRLAIIPILITGIVACTIGIVSATGTAVAIALKAEELRDSNQEMSEQVEAETGPVCYANVSGGTNVATKYPS